jgi:hypothetical protein
MSYSTARASLLSQPAKPEWDQRIQRSATHVAVLTLATLFGSASLSHATVLVSDNFNYPNGGLNLQNGGTGWGGNVWFNTSANVTNGVAGGTGDSTAKRNFAASLGSTGTIWVSFDWGNSAAPTENSSYGGLTFYNGTSDGGTESFLIGNTWPGTGHGLWRMTGSAATTELNYPGMKTAVAKLDLAAGTASLWVGATGSPVDVSGAAMATATGLNLANLGGVRILGADFGGSVSQSFDNLVIGTDMTDVAAVPEPSAALLGGLGLIAALLARRGARSGIARVQGTVANF